MSGSSEMSDGKLQRHRRRAKLKASRTDLPETVRNVNIADSQHEEYAVGIKLVRKSWYPERELKKEESCNNFEDTHLLPL